MDRTIQDNANFLQNLINRMPTNNFAQLLLKSFYTTRLVKEAAHKIEQIEHSIKCKKCLTDWTNGKTYRMDVLPAKSRKKRYTKLVTGFEAMEKLSKSRLILAKKYQKLTNNITETTCLVCKNKTKTIIRHISKRKHTNLPKENGSTNHVDLTLKANNVDGTIKANLKKRKKPKDKCAGLNSQIVEKINRHINQKHSSDATVSAKLNSTALPQALNSNAKKSASKNVKPVLKTDKIIRNEKKSAAAKQRNNLLKLANVLKIQNSKKPLSSPCLKLEHLLK